MSVEARAITSKIAEFYELIMIYTITGTVTYSNAAYHNVGNALILKTAILHKSHVAVYIFLTVLLSTAVHQF